MKKLFFACVVVALYSCNSKPATEKEANSAKAEQSTGTFGAPIDEAGAVPVSQMLADMSGKTEMPAKVEGKIMECCQKKGCWMNIDKGDGTTMKVTFKDYGFFVPMDAGGKTAVMEGRAYVDTLSVETLKHYAEDAGQSEEEIAKITEPEVQVAFEADGVIIR